MCSNNMVGTGTGKNRILSVFKKKEKPKKKKEVYLRYWWCGYVSQLQIADGNWKKDKKEMLKGHPDTNVLRYFKLEEMEE